MTRRRVEADLAVFREYQIKYEGMLEACRQQLNWSVERYAAIPQPPELLELKHVEPLWSGAAQALLTGLACIIITGPVCGVIWLVSTVVGHVYMVGTYGLVFGKGDPPWAASLNFILLLIIPAPAIYFVFLHLQNHFSAKAANGDRPSENARRQTEFEGSMAAALRAAAPLKAAEDHRLRCQIRELEGWIKTIGEKEAGVRRILATL